MADFTATFDHHKITNKGLYIRGYGQGLLLLEIFVPRAEAELFEWITPLDEDDPTEEEEECDLG